MAAWAKEEIELKDGTKVAAQMPVIVSASRSTDIPAFYSEDSALARDILEWHVSEDRMF